MVNFRDPGVSVHPAGPLTGPGAGLGGGHPLIGNNLLTPLSPLMGTRPQPPLTGPGSLGPKVIDVGTQTPDPTQTGSTGGGMPDGSGLPTLDALLARQKELSGGGVQMGEMTSPWQGASYALQQGLEGFQQGRNDRDILAQEMQRAQILRGIGEGGVTMEHVAAMSEVDPAMAAEMYKTVTAAGTDQWDPVETPAGENGQWFRNRKTGETKKVGGGSPGEEGIKKTDISTWRGQVLSDETYVNARKVVPTYNTMLSAAKDTSGPDGKPGKISDLALVYGMATMLDPGSVVKEGEQIMVRNAQNLPDWLLGKINGLNGGQEIGDDTRMQIMTLAHEKASGVLSAYDAFAKTMRESAQRNGFNPDDIAPDLGTVEPWDGSRNPQDDDDKKY